MNRKHRNLDAEDHDRKLLRESAVLVLKATKLPRDAWRAALVLACHSLNEQEGEELRQWLIERLGS